MLNEATIVWLAVVCVLIIAIFPIYCCLGKCGHMKPLFRLTSAEFHNCISCVRSGMNHVATYLAALSVCNRQQSCHGIVNVCTMLMHCAVKICKQVSCILLYLSPVVVFHTGKIFVGKRAHHVVTESHEKRQSSMYD